MSSESKSGGDNKQQSNIITLLLDSGANINLIHHLQMLKNKRKSKESGIKSASGQFDCEEVAELTDELNNVPLSSKSYYLNKENAANILLLSMLSDEYRVFMDTAIDNAFYVFDDEGKYIRFGRCPISNLYRLDINLHENGKTVLNVITVEDRMEEFSSLEYSRAKAARDLKYALICPSDQDLAHAIEYNIIGNNEFRREDIRNATRIFEPSEIEKKGKSFK